MTEDPVLNKAIKTIVLSAEKKLSINNYYGISNVASAEELKEIYSILDGLVYEGKRFKVVLRTFIEGDYRCGAQIHYIVTDQRTKIEYKVIHSCPNRHFDNKFGWYIEKQEVKEK